MVVAKGVCDCCGRSNECAVIEKRALGFFVVKVSMCQSCVSKTFKLFKKDI